MAEEVESLLLETRDRWKIPNDFCCERNPAALRAARQLWEGLFPDIRFRSISGTYNCVGLVVASRRVIVLPEHLERILTGDGYRRLRGPEEAEHGDVVVYQDEEGAEPTHVGIVVRKNLISHADEDTLTILSKWGRDGEYEHKSRCVPEVYGRPTQYWTDRRDP